ncbi:hypothetical protein ACVWW4_006636 [Bradyrhizobium sp. LB7.1]
MCAHGLDCVAHTIAKYIKRSPAILNVVTGLRTVEEVSLLVERFRRARIVFVDADVRTRFERHVRRARDKDVKAFVDFEKQDEQQARFGVLRVPTEIATDVVRNDGTLELYKERIDSLIATMTDKDKPSPQPRGHKSELYRTLNALSSLLKNLEMENFHFSAGRFWSGAVELDVISSLLLSVPRRGVAMRRAVWEFGSGYRRSD